VATRYPHWGYRFAEGFLRQRGWQVNRKRVHRIWRQQGLQIPSRKLRKKIKTGMTLQPIAKVKNAVWSWDFVHDVTTTGESFRCLTVKDEATRLCLAIEVDRSLSHERVIAVLTRLMARYGRPRYIRSDNGPELVAQALQAFFNAHGIQPSRIEPGKPWQNGSNESFNGTLRRECLDAEQFRSVTEARVVIEDWRHYYNQQRPHSALGYQTPATAYWGQPSRKTIGRRGARGKSEMLLPTIEPEATIIARLGSEVGVEGGSLRGRKTLMTQKT
jgi:putative transposase